MAETESVEAGGVMSSPETNRALGCDVSHLHPIIDFPKVRASCSLICVKATEGLSFEDPKLDFHRIGLLQGEQLPLVVYYHFARSGDPKSQAKFFVEAVRKTGTIRSNERFALDLEVIPTATTEPHGQTSFVIGWVEDFYKTLFDLLGDTGTRRQHFVYTSWRIWSHFGDPDWNVNFPYSERLALWAPRYNVEPHYPLLPKPWRKWQIWQWSDGVDPPGVTHPVSGISGNCDLNVWNGTASDLQQWMADQEQPAVASGLVQFPYSRLFHAKTMASGLTDADLESLKIHILTEQEARAKSAKT